MSLCDICCKPAMGTIISAENMRVAVFSNGFDPFHLKLITTAAAWSLGAETGYLAWKSQIVAQDNSDWNICSACMSQLGPHLPQKIEAAGISESQIQYDPRVASSALAAAEKRYGPTSDRKPGSPKREATRLLVPKWYFAENPAKRVRQVVVLIPTEARQSARFGNVMPLDQNIDAFMAQPWAALTLLMPTDPRLPLGLGPEEPVVFVRAAGLVDVLPHYPARVAFSFYRLDAGGVFYLFVDVPSPKVEAHAKAPFLVENPHTPGSEAIGPLLARDRLEICFTAPGDKGPNTAYFSLVVQLPSDCRSVLKREWDNLLANHKSVPPSRRSFPACMAQFERENPTNENPILLPPRPVEIGAVQFRCPGCHKILAASAQAGQHIRCPSCRRVMRVPQPQKTSAKESAPKSETERRFLKTAKKMLLTDELLNPDERRKVLAKIRDMRLDSELGTIVQNARQQLGANTDEPATSARKSLLEGGPEAVRHKAASLQAKLDALPKTGDSLKDLDVELAKVGAAVLVQIIDSRGDSVAHKRNFVQRLRESQGGLLDRLGSKHKASILLRKLFALADVMAEVEPERKWWQFWK